jgi:hypothetical protein
VVAAVALLENAAYFGNPLAFTNLAIWPKSLAYRVVADSNIDWGQGREGIRERIARARAGHTILDPLHVLPGHITLGLNAVAGVFDFEQHRWLRENLRPGGHFDHTYLWYRVGNDDYDRFLDETRRLRPEPWATTACPPELPLERHPPGARVAFALDTPPGAGDGWLVCVDARRGAEFGFRVLKGVIRFGRLDAGGGCAAEAMVPGQVSWFRLEPGRHALCAVEIPNRRAWLPYSVEGTWLVRGHAASLGMRRQSFSAPRPPAPESTSPRSSSPPLPPGG